MSTGDKKRRTRRDRFLAEIEAVTPWAELISAIEAFYPKGEGRGRPPIGLPRMLRMYVAQQLGGVVLDVVKNDIQYIHQDLSLTSSCRAACRCTLYRQSLLPLLKLRN